MAIWLPVLGGMLLGETVIILSLYWDDRPQRWHVLTISVSYLILVALGMQPALRLRILPWFHEALFIGAAVLGQWSLWRLVPVGSGAPAAENEDDG